MDVKLQKLAGEVGLFQVWQNRFLTVKHKQKAKADNKYFGAMRQKEAAEAERKACNRTVEKLQKAVDRFTEAEKGSASKLVRLDIRIVLHIVLTTPTPQ